MVSPGSVSAAAAEARAHGSVDEALRRAEASLKEALAEEQAILDTAMFGVAIMKDSTILRCNRCYAETFGYSEPELVGRSSRMLCASEEDFASLGVRASRAMAELGSYNEERLFRRKDGSEFWCYLAGKPLDAANPDRGVLWVTEDITEYKRAEAQLRRSEERLALAFRASDSGIWDWEIDTDEMFYSARFRELLGYPTLSNERFRAVYDLRDRLHPEDRERTLAAMQRALYTMEPFNEVCRLRCADGTYRWFHSRGQALGGEGGRAKRMAGSITDVTELKASEERIRHLANHDPLTGLPNRRLLQDRMEQSLLLARRKGTLVGVMVVDLDRFKEINDTAGHLVGDEVLRTVGSRLRASIREADTVARHGGDEFVVLLPELREAQDAHRVAEKMIAGVCAPIDVEGRPYQVGASVGIAIYPEDAHDGEALLHRADEAMYAAKEGGGNRARRRGA